MDWEGLPLWVRDVGPAASVTLSVVFMILRGWLVPRKTLDSMLELHKLRADEWKATAEQHAARATTAEAQAATLATELATQTQLLRSIKEEAARRRSS